MIRTELSMLFKRRIWQLTTAIVVVMLFASPEFFQLGLFIDAIGLDMVLMLLEVQFVLFFNHVMAHVKNSWAPIARNRWLYRMQAPVVLMHGLVCLAIAGVVIQA